MRNSFDEATICVVGLGYVGLPLLEAFAKHFRVIGFDVDNEKIEQLKQTNHNQNVLITDKPEEIGQADFVIICVPTPLTKSKEPDLGYIESAAQIVGKNMKKGCVVVLESTVYPGVTEEIVKPTLEGLSDLKCGQDFKIAYSPERINPGDTEHTIDKITKVVAGMDDETTKLVADLYEKVAGDVFTARDIKTAEAAKVIENIQRDLNIALMNELSLIFDKMGLNTRDVLDAAGTKWNFHTYSPGLVGGHCIPVDPHYLVYKAKELGHHPQVITAGRAINDSMPEHVAEMTIKALNHVGKVIKDSKVLIIGLSYKENVADTRESPVKGIIKKLKEYDIEILGYDPLLDNIDREFGIESYNFQRLVNAQQVPTNRVDGLIVAVAHDILRQIKLHELRSIMTTAPILIDVRGIFSREEAEKKGFFYREL